MKYTITSKNPFLTGIKDYGGTTKTDARAAADWILEHSQSDFEEEYDSMLDECYGEIEICGYSYSASIALYRTDPTAYACNKSDYEDSRASDIAHELDRMDDGDEEDYYGYTITAEDDEDTEDDEGNT